VLAVVLAGLLAMLVAAGPISRLVGSTGAQVISRLMGMLLAALATTLILSAVVDWLTLPKL
jgi:multiple antibiotic resistance protein